MHWPRNRNALAVIVIIILAVAIAVVGLALRPLRTVSDASLPGTKNTDDSAAATDASLYLLVTAGGTTYKPILLEEENVLTLSQGDMVNVVHVTPVSIQMESATCDNQDCVEQGVVTAENRKTRILGNTIVCLPHRVLLELFTADELQEIGFPVPENQASGAPAD